MKNMKTAVKLVFSFGIVMVLAIFIGLVGIFGMNNINNADDELYNYNLIAISKMGEIREELQVQRNLTRDFTLNAGNADRLNTYKQSMAESEADLIKYFAEYEDTITDTSEEAGYFEAKRVYENEYKKLKEEILNASYSSEAEAKALLYDPVASGYISAMVSGFAESMENNNRWAKEQVEENTALFHQMTIAEIIVLAVAILAVVILVSYISGLISKPLIALTRFMNKASTTGDIIISKEDEAAINAFSKTMDEVGQCIGSTVAFINRMHKVGDVLQYVADGDLTTELELLSERDTMGVSLNKMMDNLNSMFGEIISSTDQVSNGARQVADGSQSLAQGSTEQAASVEELSSTISEIAQKTNINSGMADKAAELAVKIKGNAEKGNSQMNDMISAVQEINHASQNISNVIKAIDDIAFQTNILALNAAVEAARAGEAGKGFAVVAEEVRNLAAKSAEAAKNTESLIANSMEKAELGASIANMTAESLNEIVLGINESAQIVSEIAKSSREQSGAISQVNQGIDQVAQVVQQNSATAEESAAASEEMNGQSEVLKELMTQFKLRHSRLT